jgi:fermentation-respiration switch protein FrsA (DUF1100 family)
MYRGLNVNVLIFDYRGYGNSTGTPTERGLELDAEAVLEYALGLPTINPKKLYIYGKSLGGAVALSVATKVQDKVLGLVLENSFTSLAAVISQHMPYLNYVQPLLLANYWPSIERVPSIRRPILFIYAEHDELIDNSNTKKLHEAATASIYKRLYMVRGGSHNTCHQDDPLGYLRELQTYMEEVAAKYSLPELIVKGNDNIGS